MMTSHIYLGCHLGQHVRLFQAPWVLNFIYVDDNALPHRANIVNPNAFQSAEDITCMDWSAYSPDLNPIEHVWDMLGRQIVYQRPQPPPVRLQELPSIA
ncbi:transposable element Tcb2 transposase [Trichonephila clavipes]|nr:transposable element Tcb2 transposase [Trichonephila clavipes]